MKTNMNTDKITSKASDGAESAHSCDNCGCDLSYSKGLHCAACHREMWTFRKTYAPHNGFGNSTNLFD